LRRREGVGDEADRLGSDRTSSPRAPGKKERGARRRVPRSSSAPAEPGLPSGARRRPGPTKSGHTRR